MLEQYKDCINMGIGYMSSEEYDKAIKKFEEALEYDSQDAEVYIHLGNAYANKEEYNQSIAYFKKALVIKKDDGEVLFNIGNIYFLKDEYADAIKYYNRAEKSGYEYVELYEVMAEIFIITGDFVQALRNINKAIAIEPLNGELWIQKVALQINMGSYDEALETLEEFKEVLPDSIEIYHLASNILCKMDRIDEAELIALEAVSKFPEDGFAKLIHIKVLIEAGKFEKAQTEIDEIKIKGIATGLEREIALQESMIYAYDNRTDKVIETLQHALEYEKDDPELLHLLLTTYVTTRDFNKIYELSEYMTTLDLPPEINAEARFYYAKTCKELKGTEKAQKMFETLVKDLRRITIDNPTLYEVYIYRLLCDIEVKNYEEALELADYLETLYPEKADGHAFRYLVYKDKGDEKNAELEFEKAKKANPNIGL